MKTTSTTMGLAIIAAVSTGGLGLSLTGVFDSDESIISASNTANGLLMGHLTVEAHDEMGELIAYRQSDNEVVDDGEQCILKMLFATTDGTAGRGGYTSTGACTGILTGAWDVIAIGTNASYVAEETHVLLFNETSSSDGLERGIATTKTWTNGTGYWYPLRSEGDRSINETTTKIVLSKTFTNDSPRAHTIAESGLFNSTTPDANGMLARQTFTGVALSNGDSITITWTFTAGN